jgi:hypothetical protein
MGNRMVKKVSLSLCLVLLVACGDDSSEPNPEPEPEPDAGDPVTCEAKPLSAYCDDETCPSSFDDALESWCSTSGDGVTEQASSCGGRSVRSTVGQGATTFHFDEDDELVGVYIESDLVLACSPAEGSPTSSDQAYGRECTLSGTPTKACQEPCPDIDCISGAKLETEWPFDFEQAHEIPITACHNDVCLTGMLSADANRPSVGNGTGFIVESPEGGEPTAIGQVEVMFRGLSGGGVSLEVQWWASDAGLNDGDRYRVTADAPGGLRVLIDREVDYGLNEVGSGACYLSCKYIELDLRGEELDGGVEDGGE